MDLFEKIKEELLRAELARAEGNEGMARVCARRAAGLIAGEYLRRRGLAHLNPSAYARLQYLLSLPDLSPQVQEIASHFMVRITTNHTLPVDADLVAEAHWLGKELLDINLQD